MEVHCTGMLLTPFCSKLKACFDLYLKRLRFSLALLLNRIKLYGRFVLFGIDEHTCTYILLLHEVYMSYY